MRSGSRWTAGEVEVLYDLVAARHAVTILVHAWRRQARRRGRARPGPVGGACGALARAADAGGPRAADPRLARGRRYNARGGRGRAAASACTRSIFSAGTG